ncbi:MAG: ABC-2 family transporter protein [Clostridia bacterium]|nr:ABC-2 family transporter protein [Clostridia bacterium]
MRKYIEIFKYSLKTKLAFIFDYLVSIFSYAIHIFVFNELWDYILQGKAVAGYTKKELIWYIIITEFVVYATNKSYKRIAEKVRNGEIANMLVKPINFLVYTIAEQFSVLIKVGVNFIFGIMLGLFMAGAIDVCVESIIITIISLIISIFMTILIDILLGIISFYTEENQSFYLIIQKLIFFAVFIPIEFYPEWAQKILFCIPLLYSVYAPGKIFVNFDLQASLILLLKQFIAMLVILGAVIITYKKGVKKINVNGG